MNKNSSVIDPSGNYEENIDRLSKHLGKSMVRRQVFSFVYGKGTRPKSVEDISKALGSGVPIQSIRNAVNYLSSHNLILKELSQPKSGRPLMVYSKQEFVRANRDMILRLADNPALVEKLATKRRPAFTAPRDKILARSVPRNSSKPRYDGRAQVAKVLYLTASPSSQHPLRTDAEVSQVQQAVRGSRYREKISIISSPAASPQNLIDGLNDHEPQVVHFSGHGGHGGVWFDDGRVEESFGQDASFKLLAELFKATSNPPTLVVFNSCDTLEGAEVLLDSVPAVVAMSDSISDLGATTFAVQLYGTIAAGETIENAVNQGIIAMKFSTLYEDADLPHMIFRSDFDPSKFRIVR